jgi:hypothetical protein
MKITEKQLRQIIREERQKLVREALPSKQRVFLEDLEPGVVYRLATSQGSLGTSEFVGWKIEDGAPRMMWLDPEDGTEWEAYLYNDEFSVGSSGLRLKVLGVVPQGAGDVV